MPAGTARCCTMEWCDTPLYSKGLCKNCYEKKRRGTLADPRIPKPVKVCSFEDCGRPVSSSGLCSTHYMMKYSGRPLRPIRTRLEVPERPGQRYCRTCNEWKDREDDFYNTSHTSGGKQNECKDCLTVRARANKLRRDRESGLLSE